MFTDPDGFRRLHTARRALFRGPPCFHLDDVRAVQLRFVFKQRNEPSPRRILLVASVAWRTEHGVEKLYVCDNMIVIIAISVASIVEMKPKSAIQNHHR